MTNRPQKMRHVPQNIGHAPQKVMARAPKSCGTRPEKLWHTPKKVVAHAPKSCGTCPKSCPEKLWHMLKKVAAHATKSCGTSPKKLWHMQGLGKIDCNRYSIAIFFTFCSLSALEPFSLNEYRIWPCLYFFFGAIRYSIFDSFCKGYFISL